MVKGADGTPVELGRGAMEITLFQGFEAWPFFSQPVDHRLALSITVHYAKLLSTVRHCRWRVNVSITPRLRKRQPRQC